MFSTFIVSQHLSCDLPANLTIFEPIVRHDMELPLICVGAKERLVKSNHVEIVLTGNSKVRFSIACNNL